jgi:hypothetical protein
MPGFPRFSHVLPVAALAAITSLVVPACTTTCTEVACEDRLAFVFDEPAPLDYVVTVTIGGETGTADCTAAAHGGEQDPFRVELSNGVGVVECGSESLVLIDAPTQASITITYANGTNTDATAKPAYEEFYPNGEDCEPVCQQAEVEIDMHVPSGA